MNQKRRVILKIMAASGLTGLVGFGVFKQLNEKDDKLTLSWLKQMRSNTQFSQLQQSWPDPYNSLVNHAKLPNTYQDETALELVAKQIKLDFLHKQTITLNHWHLSQTEVLVILSAINLLGFATTVTVVNDVSNAPFEDIITIEKWGPQETYQGVKFNEQPDGHCGLWVVSSDVPDGIQVYINGEKRNIFVNEKGFTTGIYTDVDAFINQVGSSDILIYDTINHRKQIIGNFNVLPAFDFHQYEDGSYSAVFSQIVDWGPKNSYLGEAFNQQPNGHAAFWFKLNSMSSQVFVNFNGHQIKATVRKDIITASMPVEYLPLTVGEYPVYLSNEEKDESFFIGDIHIVDRPEER